MPATRAFAAAAAAVAEQIDGLDGAAVHVTGASGFIAANLLALLDGAARAGGPTLALHASARRPASEVELFRFLGARPPVTWSAPPQRATIAPGAIVVHTASPRDYLSDPLETFRANTEGLLATFEAAARAGARHVVYMSSAEVYGELADAAIPTSEERAGRLDPADPRSIYGESKRMAEVLGATLAGQSGIPFTAVRASNLYGPGQRLDDGRVPMAFMRAARERGRVRVASDGTARRSPCFVWDGLVQLAAVLDPARADGSPINIGHPSGELSIQELAAACAELGGCGAGAVDVGDAPPSGPSRCVVCIDRVAARARRPLPAPRDLGAGLALLREWVDWSLADAGRQPAYALTCA